jgi:hypothetical protein
MAKGSIAARRGDVNLDDPISQLYELRFPNGKSYWGYTTGTARHRYGAHVDSAKRGSKLPIHAAIRKYGAKNTKILLRVVGRKSYIGFMEKMAIAEFRTCDRQYGYNISIGGPGPSGPLFARILKEAYQKPEVKKRHRAAMERPDVVAKQKLANEKSRAQRIAGLEMGRSSPKLLHHMSVEQYDPQYKKKHSEATKTALNDPIIRAKHLAAIERLVKDAAFQRKRLEGMARTAVERGKAIAAAQARPETKNKMRESAILAQNRPGIREKKQQDQLGSRWITDGVACIKLKKGEPLPDGWSYGRIMRPDRKSSGPAISARAKSDPYIFITDGVNTKRQLVSEPIPKGWRRGRVLPLDQGDRIRAAEIGKIWINNGIRNSRVRRLADVPDGWVVGRLWKKKDV